MQLCPDYMAMGMSYREFWHSNTKVHWACRKAWEQRKAYRNWEMWWQCGYIYETLLRVAPVIRTTFGGGRAEAGKYPDEPYPLTAKEAEARKEQKRREKLRRMIAVFEKESELNALRAETETKGD